ncbi:MAG: CBS and ACT domain-containing protein [Desulfobulbus sp.]|jgi:acetoin utilization protein AcuB|uniref:CBS and ACT domain-containing protein n=1 Tax=Desulfobulbus sp. TaxID=895 RepID=UPI00283EE716|nr:CBS and ACT domain-containing protein [Desulfobulbus sp.]MDR2549897.1 CBS and ACT domain-containing protein [Desulfobulbus sp.]
MLVKNWMNTPAITIDQQSSMQEAINLLKTHRISMLPVMDKNRLVGIVTDRDLKKSSPSDATTLEIHELLYLLSTVKVKDIMSAKPITVPKDFTIEETAEVLMSNKISGVPVVDIDGSVVGVITHTDLFKVIISLTGIGKKGIQFAFALEDREGSILEVAHIIRQFGGRIASILTSYEKVPEGYRNVYIRMYSIDRVKLEAMKTALKEKSKLLYMVDHKNNTREIY